jgi:hypothetical protein
MNGASFGANDELVVKREMSRLTLFDHPSLVN